MTSSCFVCIVFVLLSVASGWLSRSCPGFVTRPSYYDVQQTTSSSSILWQQFGDVDTDESESERSIQKPEISIEPPLTSVILRVAYDGTRFTGWSAANDPPPGSKQARLAPTNRRRRRRSGASLELPMKKGYVLSVQGILRANLAKVYGNLIQSKLLWKGRPERIREFMPRG